MDATHFPADPRVVLVHDWLTGRRGGEKCLELLCRRWPSAPLMTLLYRRGSVSPTVEGRVIRTSPLHLLPVVHRYYRYLLPLMPAAAATWRLPPCDLVVSLSHCVAKAARPPRGVPHLCYCFTPMRYAWHLRAAYFGETGTNLSLGSVKSRALDHVLTGLRDWDRQTADRVTRFVAISRTVQQRILDCYGRESDIVYPPVDTDFYTPEPAAGKPRDDYYLIVSAFAPYKRIDLAVEACNRLGRRLRVIGSGQDAGRLRAAAGPTIELLGWQSDEVIRSELRRCRALLFPGEEDFGIVPVEAMACGTPVVAYGRGGATETVVPPGGLRQPTGLFFEDQTADCLAEALLTFERLADTYDPAAARRQALRFHPGRFEDEFLAAVNRLIRPEVPRQARRAA